MIVPSAECRVPSAARRGRMLPALTLLILILLLSLPLNAQVQAEFGYRWADIDGNKDLYRTVVNERSGFLVRSLSFFAPGKPGLTDNFRIDATDIGSGPASAFRIETGRSDLYRLVLGYRRIEGFSALPAFANPLLGAGVVPGQHTYDRTRSLFDADVEFLGLRKFTPFVGYSFNRNEGPGTTTYFLGQDEFRLASDLNDRGREVRVGTSFDVWKLSGQITQGWRSLRSDEDLTLAAGGGPGNNLGPILGREVTAQTLTRSSRTDVDAPFTNLFVTADVLPRVKLIGSYIRLDADADSTDDESAAGAFVSFPLSRFFDGLTETIVGRAKNDTRRGAARAEFALNDRMTVVASYQDDHRELSGSSLIRSLFLNSITFGGADRRDFEEIVNTASSIDRDEEMLGAALHVRALGPFSLRIGFTDASQDVVVAEDLAEIVVPGNQSGRFNREIQTFDSSATFARSGFTLGAAWRNESADRPVLRTDFVERDRIRVRGMFRSPGGAVGAGLAAEYTSQQNDQEGIGYDANSHQWTGDLELAPNDMLQFRWSYTKIAADSKVTIRRPETLALDTSSHREDGNAMEGGVRFLFKSLTFDGSATRYDNDGTTPFHYNRERVRVSYDFPKGYGIAGEWAKDKYADFDATRLGVYLRLRQ